MPELKQKKLRGKKKLMFECLRSSLSNVTYSVKQVGISRSLHYKWVKEDKNYEAQIKDCYESVKDFAENALLKKMKEGDTRAIIFFMKMKCKDRGYSENNLADVRDEMSKIKINVIMPDDREEGKGDPCKKV